MGTVAQRAGVVIGVAVGLLAGRAMLAQTQGDAQALVQRAVSSELAADQADHSLWRYHALEKEENNSLYDVVDTTYGELKEKIEEAGKPLSPGDLSAQQAKVRSFLTDKKAQAKQKHDGDHDDASATKLLNLLPRAFIWTVGSENGELITLHFAPDSRFHPPDIESRVLGAMRGDLVIDKEQYRIRTIRGTLAHDVDIGYGILGRLRQGGTFDVERRKTGPGVWQITETHVHIDGKALLFKTIGQQTDEVKTGFVEVPQSTTLAQGAAMLGIK
jgi:uncharacterized membrane-anchored protein YhcB (DUF1043 family)